MKVGFMISTVTLAIWIGGCNSTDWQPEQRAVMNEWMIDDYNQDMIAGGVVAQHTLYDHHFLPNSAVLNELGDRDVTILANAYAEHPGQLNIRRGSESPGLYKQRVDTVRNALAAAGVEVKRLALGEANPGGDGLSSEQVVYILENRMNEPLSEDGNSKTGVSINSSSK